MNTKELRFQELRRASGFTSKDIAEAAGVSIGLEYAFEIGGTVNKTIKEKVVQAFARLTGHPYTLGNFEHEYIEEQETVALRKKASAPLLPSGAKTDGQKHIHQ